MEHQYVLVLGAGRSSAALIRYLLDEGAVRGWTITVGDIDEAMARQRVGAAPHGRSVHFDVADDARAHAAIAASDLVISLLPAALHPKVAALCLACGKHLLTASYVSPAMQALHDAALAKGLLFLNECGLDPGLDHMSAMAIIHRLQADGYEATSFESFTGGLIDPATDSQNPWKYRFTWNPRNVVVAGQGTAKYRAHGTDKYIPYHQLFQRTTPIEVPGVGKLDGYANRDSLQYREVYGLQQIDTMVRGTLRFQGFCSAWNVLVQLGVTDDSYFLDDVAHLTHRDFLERFVPAGADSLEQRVARVGGIAAAGPEMDMLRWAGFFDSLPVGRTEGTPAQITETILSKCWALQPAHRDLVVMWHRFRARRGNLHVEIESQFHARGDAHETAMAKTVGLPLAIAAKLLLIGTLIQRGVVVPVVPAVYVPILRELEALGIRFTETERAVSL
jgi:saccharopine dehydrogenase (NADP+, L-glutamate forming)